MSPNPSPPTNDSRRRRLSRPWWAGAVLIALCALLYVVTLDNGLQEYELRGGDLITHQYAQVQARPSNAPGYPLYTMGGWLWFHTGSAMARLAGLHTPNPLPILSSYSTVWALLAVGLLYAVILDITRSRLFPRGNWPVAWLVAAFYAVTYFFWYYATTTEQYSSAVAQTLAIVYVYLRWRDAAGTRESGNEQHALRLLFLLAFLCGLSLAHMLTIAFIVPPLIVAILWQRPDYLRNVRAIVGSVVAAAVPLTAYLYVYVRGAQHPEWWGTGEWESVNQWFWAFVSTAQGREELGWAFEPGTTFVANGFPELIWRELSIPLLILGLAGILLLDRKLITVLYGMIGLTLLFSWAYRYGNWYQVIMPAYPLILIGAAALADWSMQRAHDPARPLPSWQRGLLSWGPPLALALLVLWRLDASLPAADSRNRPEDNGLSRAATLLGQPMTDDAALFAAVDDALAMQYLLQIWFGNEDGRRVVSSPDAATHLSAGVSVYSTVEALPTLLAELPPALAPHVQMAGPDWQRLTLAGPEQSAPQIPVNAAVQDGVELVGMDVHAAPDGAPVLRAPEAALDVTLYWALADGTWPDGLNISVRPMAAGALMPVPNGTPGEIIQRDAGAPAQNRWDAGAPTVADAYRLPTPIPADAVQIVLYRAQDGTFSNVAELVLPLPPD